MLNIVKDYVNNNDQFTRKTPIAQHKFFDLVNLVLTITIISERITNNHRLPQSQQQTQATDIQAQEIRMSIIYCPLKVLVKNYGVYPNLTK